MIFMNQTFFMRKLFNLLIVFLSLILAMNTSEAQVQQAWAIPFRYSNHSSLDHGNAVTTDANGNVYVLGPTAYGDGDESEDGMVTIKYDKNGVKLWSSRFPGRELYRTGPSIAVDASGNVYVAGRKERDVAPWAFPLEYVIVKYNSSGAVQWSRTYEGPRKRCLSVYMAIDAASNVYVTGASLSDEGEEADFYSPTDIATLKFDKDGTLKWTRRYNGAAPNDFDDEPNGMVVDASGNVYITGNSQKDGRISSTTIKYNTDGAELWVQRYNATATSWDVGTDIIMDASGNLYVCSKNFTSSTTGETNISTLKYDNNGVLQWVKQFDSGEDDLPGSIGIDGAGNVYVAGFSDQSSTFPNNYALTVLKYNNAGDAQWVKNYPLNVSGNPYFFDDQPEDHFARLVIGNDNNLYISTPISVTGESLNYLTLKYDPGGNVLWTQQFNGASNQEDYPGGIAVDALNNVYVTGLSKIATGNIDNFITIKYTQCTLNCPGDITVNNDAGQCGAIVNYPEATTTGDCGSTITYSKASGTMFDIGTTTVTATSTETSATCSFNVTVVDNTLPVISCPSDKTINVDPGVCYASATTVNAGTATATDNCAYNVAGSRSDGLALTANYPVGVTTIKWIATDASNNTATCLQTITVVDNVPPTISGELASAVVLSPTNHTMRDVTISYTATDNCAVSSIITVTSNEPINGVGDGDTDPDWMVIDNHHVKLRAERSANGTGRIYTITIAANDPSGNISTKTVEVRVPHNVNNPHSGQPFKVGSTVTFDGEFWDKPGNSHSAKWMLDDNLSVKGIVTEPVGNKNGKVTGSYKFTTPGVYKLQMNVTDQNGITNYANTNGDLEAIVVIYDPNGGNTYGGGYFNSPAGSLRSNPSVTGKASYGFAMNYFKNSTNPKGETQFEFKVGSFEFNALNFEYLVISNSMAQFKGTGKIIGGQSGVGFTMTVVDGQLDGTGVDKIRMKIYIKNNGSVIYDNQPGASDAALPTQAVGTNSTVVISGINSSLTQSNTTQKAELEATASQVSSELDVIAYPNPSATNFSISVKANSVEGKITMQVVDMYGRIIETRNVNVDTPIRFGDRYNSGTFFVRILQGKEHKEIKLIKLSD
jgi:hypothetical protein